MDYRCCELDNLVENFGKRDIRRHTTDYPVKGGYVCLLARQAAQATRVGQWNGATVEIPVPGSAHGTQR